jgi:uncharacterized protein YecE (DUF72 family)
LDTLFDEQGSFDRDKLASTLAHFAKEHIYIGSSSWKYEGWLGQIYRRSNYMSRGRFSKKIFEAECLREYAQTFQTVCGDFAFYQFPTEEYWRRLFDQAPPGFRFAFKVPEQITCKVFPGHARYGPQAGTENSSFLDSFLLHESFLRPLDPYRDNIAVLIFEFGAFSQRSFPSVSEFIELLDPFLAGLPKHFRYAVEIRNPEFLEPRYFDCLRRHNVAHVYNAWSRMPELKYQIQLPESVTADFIVSRALLRYGRSYENAVRLLTPYGEVQDPNPEARSALRQMIEQARQRRLEAYIYVNNRLEGNAPATIMAIVE